MAGCRWVEKRGLPEPQPLNILMVRLAGLEPATYGLEVRCSIHLSYRRSGNKKTKYHKIGALSIRIIGRFCHWISDNRLKTNIKTL